MEIILCHNNNAFLPTWLDLKTKMQQKGNSRKICKDHAIAVDRRSEDTNPCGICGRVSVWKRYGNRRGTSPGLWCPLLCGVRNSRRAVRREKMSKGVQLDLLTFCFFLKN
jgi:hypothetical protein